MNDLEKAIVKTLAYFDIFDYPLTDLEIYKWLYKYNGQASLSDIRRLLASSEILPRELSLTEGFYSLKGREDIYRRRKLNNNLAERKFAKVLKLVKFYRFVPYIKMVAVCNSLAYSNARDESDIDFFIITQKNKIWLARFFAVILARCFGYRPSKKHTRDAYCLSFFIDEAHLDISNVALGKNDIYLAYWIKQLMPIYNPHGLYAKFWQANNWSNDFLPQAYPNKFSREVLLGATANRVVKFLGFIISPPLINKWLDALCRGAQIRIIGRHTKSLINVDTRVIVSETMLKFHYNDRREDYFKKWKEIIYKLLDKYETNSKQII